MKRNLSRRRAFTLIEILVVTGVGTVVFGLALAAMIEMKKASRGVLDRQSAIQQANAVLVQAVRTLESAVPPDALDLESPPRLLLSAEALEVLTFDHPFGPVLYRARLESVAAGNGEAATARLERAWEPIGATISPGSPPVRREREPLGGPLPKGWTPTLRFAYAAPTEPAAEPRWLNRWEGADLPPLVRVSVEFSDGTERAPFRLTTAVVPGLRSRAVAAPAPVAAPDAVPAPAAAPAVAPSAPAEGQP